MLFQFTLLTFVASVMGAFLQARQSFPTCALTCIQSATTTGCSSSDQACLCASPAFVTSATDCFQSTCSEEELGVAVQTAEGMCASVGVEVTYSLSSTAETATDVASSTESAFEAEETSDSSISTSTDGAVNIRTSMAAVPLVVLAVLVLL